MELNGWRKQWRKTWDNPVISNSPNTYMLWGWLLDHVMWVDGVRVKFAGETIELKKGQITCGTHQIATDTHIPQSTVHRLLKYFENEKLIEKRTDMQCSLVTVINWERYQGDEKGNEKRVRNERETSEKRVDTKEEVKNIRSKEHSPTESEAQTPGQQTIMFFETPEIQQKAVEYFTSKGMGEEFARTELQKFILYWTEPTANGKKQRWQKQPTFDVRRRLVTWFNNNNGFKKTTHSPIEQL